MFISKAYAASEEAAAPGAFPPFDSSTFASQLFWLAITFGFLYWFMSKVITPRLGEIIETRQDRIAGDLDKANELKEKTDEAIAAYEQELADARRKANEIGQKARDAAKAEADAESAKAEASLAEKIAASEKAIADMRNKALGEVDTIAEDTAAELVAKLIGGKTTKADLTKAIAAAKN